jgi:methylated-DNA-[protein]-cysteine S-methyltransferase
MDKLYYAYYKSEIGIVEIAGTPDGIVSISLLDDREVPVEFSAEVPPCLQACYQQLEEYFQGKRKDFQLKLLPKGTEFQKKVWERLAVIPYGKTVAYRDIACEIGNPKAVRAVGSANSRNPLWIVVPCHRVIGSSGDLTGYAGGLWRKKWLLEHEQKVQGV